MAESETEADPAAVYEQRVNAAMDFIQENLGQDLQLAEVARAAGFSPFHFHRLFAALVGERLSAFVVRQRTERAAALLIDQPNRTISQIGADCGFGTPSAFARAFKGFYGVTPRDWRAERRAGDLPATRFATPIPAADVVFDRSDGSWTLAIARLDPARVSVRQLDQIDVAYLRHTGRFQGAAEVFAALFGRLHTWARTVGIDPSAVESIAWYHDDPNLTADELLRFSGCIPIPFETEVTPPVNRASIGGGSYAVAEFDLADTDYGSAWNGLLGSWLPQSGLEPDDRHYFERFPADTEVGADAEADTGATAGTGPDTPGQRRRVQICIPVRPLFDHSR